MFQDVTLKLIIKDMYERVIMSVKTTCEETGDFPMTMGLHQGSTLTSLSLCADYG